MGAPDKDNPIIRLALLSNEERRAIIKQARSMIARGKNLRARSEELLKLADELIEAFRRDHPEK